MNQTELRKTGYKALIEALGVVGTLRFLQQLDIGSGDYTKERHGAKEPTLEDFQQFVVSQENPSSSS